MSIPVPAAAVGYNTQTFNPNILLGQNWIKDTQNGTTANATTNADGSVTVAGGGDTWNGQLETYLNGQGEAFGGGFYLQVTMTVPGAVSGLSPWTGGNSNEWPSIWANTVNGSVETDFVEMMGPTDGEYGATLHNWTTGSSQGVGQDIYAPNGNTLHGANTYGMLWIPATATSNGSITFYLNGLPVGTPTTWTQANPGLFGIIDGQQMVLRLGAGANSPATFSNVQVWQASTAGNSINGQPAPHIAPTGTPPVVTLLPSPDNTVVFGAVGSITDTHNNVWTITAGGQVAVNGVIDTPTSRVIKLAYEGGKVWQENADNLWWDKTLTTDVWGPNGGTATSPIPAPLPHSPDNTVIRDQVSAITDAAGNKWTLKGGQVAVNGAVDATTKSVVEIAYENGLVWQKNVAQLWWSKSAPSDAWLFESAPPVSIVFKTATSPVITLDETHAGVASGYGATITTTAPGVAAVSLVGWGADSMQFTHMNSVNLTAGWTNTTVTADGGTNTFIAGKGVMDVTGGVGSDSYIYHTGNATLTVEDFSAAKGDTLTVDAALKGSAVIGADGHGGTMITFGAANHSVDLKGLPSITTAGIHWV